MESGKRKKIVVSIKQKLNALKRLDNGESAAKISSDLGVGRRTIIDWIKKRTELEKLSNSQFGFGKVKKKCKYEKVGEALFLWFMQQRNKGMPITGPILKEKALQFQREFNEGGPETSAFSASEGWLYSWKKRYGIRQLTICGEKLSANVDQFSKFKETIQILIDNEGLSRDQLYNCDETGLNYKMLPSKSLAARLETSATGYKKSKERVTILACSNASGNHKLKLAFIGKSKKPRAFKHLSLSALPVSYYNQKCAWMDTRIFKTWFFDEFVPSTERFLKSVNLPRKAVLVLDNAPSHLNEDELKSGNIKTIFLPPNVTSLCQPMDQGVLKALKKKYRHRLLTALVEAIDNGEDITSKQKKINLKDVIYWIAHAWEDIEPQTFAKSWNKLLSDSEYGQAIVEDNDNINLITLLTNIPGCENMVSDDLEGWMKHDEQQELTDNDIVTLVNGGDIEDEEDVSLLETKKISHGDGVKIIDTALEYVEQQVDITSADIMVLQRLRNYAAEKKKESGKSESKVFTKFV